MKLTARLTILLALSLFVTSAVTDLSSKAATRSESLDISPRIQESPVWCWVAVGQMVFEHYDIPNVNPNGDYQCGIVGALAGPSSPCFGNCRLCNVAGGTMNNIKAMIVTYPRDVQFLLHQRVTQLSATVYDSPLSKGQVKTEIDAGRPIVTGVNFDAGNHPSQHVALIVGYDEDTEGNLILTINDPFPYDLRPFNALPNPYVKAGGDDGRDGSFTIDYDKFRSGLRWREGIYQIRER